MGQRGDPGDRRGLDGGPRPKDKRFADPAWSHPVWRRVAQSYLTTRGRVLDSVDELASM